jgi:hypothetical protein
MSGALASRPVSYLSAAGETDAVAPCGVPACGTEAQGRARRRDYRGPVPRAMPLPRALIMTVRAQCR